MLYFIDIAALVISKCQTQLGITREESEALSKALLVEHKHKKDVRKPMSALKTTVQSKSLVRRVSSASLIAGSANMYSC